METNAKDAKCESARRDGAGDSRVTYYPRPDATPEGERAALAAVYAVVVIQAHEQEKAAVSYEEDAEGR